MHSAITLPKVKRFGWNLEQCEPNVEGGPVRFLARLSAVATVWEAAEIFLFMRIMHDFTDFPSENFTTFENTTSISEVVKLWEHNFENFTISGHFLKNVQNFQFLWLQAIITLKWLQIAGNSLPNGPFTWCLVSIFTIRINSNSFPWAVLSVQERYLPKFSAMSNVRYCVLKPIVRCSAGQPSERYIEEKQTE